MKKWFAENGRLVVSVVTVVLAIALVAGIFLFGSVNAKLDTDSITLSATLTSKEKILFDEIESVELKESFNAGSRTFGVGGGKLLAGNFKNNDYGSYKLFSFSNVKKHIVIKTAKGYFVYNLKNEDLTQNSYNDLISKIAL